MHRPSGHRVRSLVIVLTLILGFTAASVAPAAATPTPTAPAAPTSLAAIRGYSSAEISFTAGANGGAAITNYKYQLDGGAWVAFSPAVTTSPVTIAGLTNGQTYSVKLQAVNSVGDGAPSDPVSVTPAVVDATPWSAHTAAAVEQWYSVAYGNGTFVAVAGDGGIGTYRVMTSTDGVSWTGRTAAKQSLWVSVAFGNGLFVAVAADATNWVMTSPDGVTWTAQSAPASGWKSMTFGNGLFVAVSAWGAVMTSSDGASWTSRTAAASAQWYSVVYGNGRFVAISTSDAVMTSTDGVNWSSETATAAEGLSSVTYGNGLFVATGRGGGPGGPPAPYVMTSPDGVTWTSRTASSFGNWGAVTFGNGLFVAVSTYGGVMTSPDGATWTNGTTAPSNTWSGVAYGNGVFVAVSYSGTQRVMSTSLTSTASAPAAPTSLVATPGDGSASIAFTAGADGGASITKYQYQIGSGSWLDAPAGTTSPVVISGLANYTTVSIKLRAYNSVGAGTQSTAVSVLPKLAAPVVTTAYTAKLYGFAQRGIYVGFNGVSPAGTKVVSYRAYAYAKGTTTVVSTVLIRPTDRGAFLTGLTIGVEYDIRVIAFLTLNTSPLITRGTLESATRTVRV